MIARRRRLDHRGLARRVQPGQQDRRFHLRRGDRKAVADRQEAVAADHGHGQPAALSRDELRAHLTQRDRHAAHGPLAQGGVAGHDGDQRVARQDAGEQARGGAGVAEVQNVLRLAECADAASPDAPYAVLRPFGLGAQAAHRLGGGEHVLALQQAGDPCFAQRQAAQHQGAVRNGLVARHAGGAGQSIRRLCREPLRRKPFHGAFVPGKAHHHKAVVAPGCKLGNILLTAGGDRGNCQKIALEGGCPRRTSASDC